MTTDSHRLGVSEGDSELRNLWRLLASHLGRYRGILVAVAVLQLLQSIALLYLPTLNADLIDNGIAANDTAYIRRVGAVMLVVTLVQVALAIGAVYFGARAAMGFGRDVRRSLFHQVTGFSSREVAHFGSPSLITRITNDVQQVQMLVLMTCTLLLAAPFTILGGVILALREDVGLSALLLVSIPVLVIAVGLVVARMVPQFRDMQDRLDVVNRVLREQIMGIRVVRAFVREPDEVARFGRANDDLTETSLHAGRLMAFFFPIVLLVLNGSSVAALWIGANRIAAGDLQVGQLVAFLTYLVQILMSVMMATFMMVMIPRAGVSAKRIIEVLRTPSTVTSVASPVREIHGPVSLELRNAGFRYPGAEAPVLADISFTASAGQTTAIIGSTGAGKTTLVSLVPRLFDVTAGAVLVDGVDIRELDLELLWSKVGLIPQKPYLFSGTVASNLRHADPEATDEDLWSALAVAQARDFVAAMPGGLDARIAQGGANVSGGQRQRLAIARALVRRPEIYLFDDSFSALDLTTDARVRAALRPHTADATVVIVGQRVSSIRDADQILVLEDGAQVGLGTHEELLADCPTYLEIVESQHEEGGGVTDDEIDPRKVAAEARAAQSSGPGRMAAAGMPVDKPDDLPGATRRLADSLRPDRAAGLLVIVLGVSSVTLSVIGPKVLGGATDIIVEGVTGETDGIDFPALHRVLLGVLVLYVCSSVLAYAQAYLLAGVVQRSMQGLRTDVEAKLNRLPLVYIDGQPRGDLLSRVTNDIDNVAQSMQQSLSQMLTAVLTMVGVLVVMLTISPLLALVALVTVPIALWTVRFITNRSKSRFMAQWARTGSLNAQVEEAFTGHALVKVFGRQQDVEDRFNETNEELFEAGFGAQFIAGVIQPVMMFLSNLNFVIIAVVGGLRVASGALSIGDVQAFIQYSRQFSQPLTQIASMMNVLQSGVASAERVFALLDADEEVPDSGVDLAPPAGAARGRVEFDRVTFSYDPAKPLITDLSLVAEPGQTVAIVGPTGAGKTTLVNLLMRFYELDGGRISLDGTDIATISRRSLRADIAMVLQDTWLFGGTIRDNIAYGNLDATEDQIREAARATYVDRFVHSLPDGYDTVIDDEAGNLSTGEKQLLTIARAFLAEPTILVLDEATSSVDTRTEVLVQHAMAALRSERTSFVIAHRLSTIRDADTILVMDAGRIVEQGSHQELLARQGAYFTLYHAQFAGALVDPEELEVSGSAGPG